jgi:membrane-bound ClpP family serine protease
MYLIIFLVLLGILLLLGELLIFTGTAISGILSVVSFAGASYVAWLTYGVTGMIVTLFVIIITAAVAALLCMRSRTWERLRLSNQIDSVSQEQPGAQVNKGAKGRTITRLAPMGKVEIEGREYEARCQEFLDPEQEVEVVGFENFTVLVKKVK